MENQPVNTATAERTLNSLMALADRQPAEIMRILAARIEQLDRETDHRFAFEYASSSYTPSGSGKDMRPIRRDYRWAAIFPVTGGSEGHYLHLVVIYQRDEDGRPLPANEYREIGIIKIFGGWDAAADLAGIIGRWIDA
jgi:hypothetical protein